MHQLYRWQRLALFFCLLPFYAFSQLITFSGQGNLLVPPGAPGQTVGITTSNANVTGVGIIGGCVTIEDVTIELEHTFVGDIGILLIGPGGRVLELSTGNGGGGDDYAGTVFSDNAGSFITDGGPPYAGSYRPEGRQQNLTNPYSNANPPGTHTFASTYNGFSGDGIWQLYINDYVAVDVGLLVSWSITFNVGGNITADAGPDVTICGGQPTTLTANGIPAATGYNWSVPGGNTQSITVSPAITTTYTVTVSNNGCTGTDQVTVFVNNAGVNVNAGADRTICDGQSTNLTATGSIGATYDWSDGQAGTPITVSPSSTTIFTVTATNAAGCTAVDQVQVTVSPAPTANAGPDLSICTGQVRTLTASGGGAPNTYTWSTGQNGASITVSPAATTTYTVTVSFGAGCSSTDEVEVSVEAAPTADAGLDETICNGESVTLTANGGPGTFAWSSGSNDPSTTVSPTSTTTYTVTVTPSNGGCTATDNVRVVVSPAANAGAGFDRNICEGVSTQLTAVGGGTYLWDTGQTTSSINVSPTATTTYTVTVTTSGGCTDEDEVTVNVTPTPVADAGPDAIICRGDAVFLSASGGTTYLWSSGQNTADITVAPTLTTTYTVRAFNGTCESSDQVVVTVAPSPSVSAGNERFICDGQSVTLTASGSFGTFEWSTGDLTQNISVSPSTTTTYTVTLTASNSCTASSSVTVNVITLSPTLTPGPTICAGQSASLNASGGGTYRWNTGQTTPNLSVTPAVTTTYTVTVTQGSCSSSLSSTVEVVPAPVANAGPDKTICAGEQLVLTASGGATYSWSDGTQDASTTVSPTSTTTFTVTVTSATGGCSATDQVRVTVAPAAVANAGTDKEVCEGLSATLTATGGGTYAWNTGQTTAGITVAPATSVTYTVTVTNSNGCTAEDEVTVLAATVPTADAGPDVTICQGETTVLSGGGGDTYTWNTGQTGGSISVAPVTTTTYTVRAIIGNCSATDQVVVGVTPAPTVSLGNNRFVCQGQSVALTVIGATGTYDWSTGDFTSNIAVSPAATTTYTVTVTAANGCTAETSVTVNVSVFVPTVTPNRTLCVGESANLTASGGTTYLWNTGQSTAALSLSPTATTTYTVTVTQGTCSSVLSTTLQVLPAPVADAGPDQSICAGSMATITASGGTAYVWNSGQNTATLAIAPATTTTYTVTVSNGNCSDTDELTVAVNANPSFNTSPDPTICAGQSASVAATSTGGPLVFAWNNGIAGSAITVNPSTSSIYTVTATNAANCTAVSTINVTVNLVPNANAGPDISLCAGNTATLNASGGGNYIWSTGENLASIVITPAVTTTYTVNVQANGCAATDTIMVTVNALPVPNATPNSTICAGESLSLLASGGGNYLWSNNITGAAITVSPGVTSTYTVTVTNTFGCSATTQTLVSVTPLPIADAGPDQIICAGQSAALTAAGGGTYQWNTGAITANLDVTPAVTTVYAVTVTTNGCTATEMVTVTVNPIPIANAGPNIAIATGQTATLGAAGGGTYQWSNGQTAASFDVAPAVTTTYTVTVTENGCQSTDEVTVFVNEPPTVDLGPDRTICRGESVTLVAAAGAPPGTSFLWSDGSTTEALTATPLVTTDFAVVLTANGLSTRDTIRVNVNQLPLGIPQVAGEQVVCKGTGKVYSIDPVNGASSYQWTVPAGANIVSGQGTTQIEVDWGTASSGEIVVSAANDCGQSPATTLAVEVNEPPLLLAPIAGNIAPCAATTGVYTIPENPKATSYEWSLDGNGTIRAGQGSNTVTVDWNNSTGGMLCVFALNACGESDKVCLDVATTPFPVANAGLPIAVCGDSAILSGAGAGVWSLLSGPGTAVFGDSNDPSSPVNVSLTGNYVFTRSISDNGCSDVDTVSALFRSIPQFAGVLESCNSTNTAFTVTLNLNGGTLPYFVNGNEVSGTVFTSAPFNAGATYTYALTDAAGCAAAVLTDSAFCNCSTMAGNMSLTPISPCVGDTLRATYLGGEQLDGDDVLVFALHTGLIPSGILELAPTPVFAYKTNWAAGNTYYISAISGSDAGTGLPALNDPCLAYSPGVPVSFRALPTATLSGTTNLCAGSCADLSFNFTGDGPYTLTYSDGTNTQTLNSAAANAIQNVCPSTTASYRLTRVSDAFCSNQATDSALITVLTPPSARVKPSDTVCNTGVSGFPTTRNFDDYVLAGDKNGIWVDKNQSGASGTLPVLDFAGLAPGAYTFTYTTASAVAPCTDSIYAITINVSAFCLCPPIDLQTPGPLCNGSATPIALNQLTPAGGPSGTWSLVSVPQGASTGVFNNNTFLPNNATAGLYRLAFTLVDAPPGTCPKADTVEVVVNAAANAGIAKPILDRCADNPQPIALADLLEGAAQGGAWFSLDGLTGSVFDASAARFNPAGQAAGTYLFRYVVPAAPGCQPDSALVTARINPLPAVDAGPDAILTCGAPNATIGLPVIGPNTTYKWSNGATTTQITVGQAGTYVLTATQAVSGCTNTDTTVVSRDAALPEAGIVSGTATLTCLQGNVALTGVSSLPTGVFTWSKEGVILGNGLSLDVNKPGCYVFRVLNSGNNCADTAQICIVENKVAPVVSLAAGGVLTCATTEVGVQANTGTTGLTYNWQTTGGNITSATNTETITAGAPGMYILQATNPINGCSTQVSIAVTENKDRPEAQARAKGTLGCKTTEVALDGTGSSSGARFTYAWFTTNGQINGDPTALTVKAQLEGTYTLTVLDAQNGCTATDTVVVARNSGVAVALALSLNPPSCPGICNGMVAALDAPNGVLLGLNGGILGDKSNFSDLCPGQYTLRTQDAYGCEWDTTVVLTEPLPLTVDLGPDLELKLGDSLLLSALPSRDVRMVQWSPNADPTPCDFPCLDKSLRPFTSQTYQIKVTDINGCTAVDEMKVRVKVVDDIYIPTAFSPNTAGENSVFTVFTGPSVARVASIGIYNRWGELLFLRLDPQPGTFSDGWDGRFKGQDINPGVFVYVVKVEYVDGRKQVFSGDLTLLR